LFAKKRKRERGVCERKRTKKKEEKKKKRRAPLDAYFHVVSLVIRARLAEKSILYHFVAVQQVQNRVSVL
jgi:hypothetical protein